VVEPLRDQEVQAHLHQVEDLEEFFLVVEVADSERLAIELMMLEELQVEEFQMTAAVS